MDGLRLTTPKPTYITTSSRNITNVLSSQKGQWGLVFSPKQPFSSLITGKCNGYDTVALEETAHEVINKREAVESENEKRNGNWVSRVLLQVWKSDEQVCHNNNDLNENHNNEVCNIDQECDACMVEDEDEDDKLEFDKNSFIKLLWHVSLGEARLYAQMAYLGSLSYTIPKIKLGNLLKRHKLRFVTSSLEMKAKTSEEVEQDHSESGVVSDDLASLTSSPCEWYICDDNESSTRYFVIQGSESLASWQANLIFEPIQFEAMEVIVHRGIYDVAKVVYEHMLPLVHEHLQRHGNRSTIRLTGHSVGGSLSLLINLMLLIRGQVPRYSLLPVITFGAPWVMCGGDRLLNMLGLPRNHLQGITVHRDIVPRAFSCNYSTRVGDLLKAVNGNFRNHPCLNNQNQLYAPMGEILILQPDAKLSPNHELLPSGSGLYVLRSQASNTDVAKKQTRAAQSLFLNTPHPLEILSDRCAYGPDGAILRDHDVDTYLTSIRSVISQELKRVRRMRRQQRQQSWWHIIRVNQSEVKLWVDGGIEWLRMVVDPQNMHLVMLLLVPYVRLLIIEVCNWIKRGYCMLIVEFIEALLHIM